MKPSLFIALLFITLMSVSQAAGKSPNILVIYADDLGFGDLQCYKPDSKIPTPNLNALASSGMKFTDAHSSSGICSPSRYAILTGRYHWRKFHGIVGVFGKSAFNAERLKLLKKMPLSGRKGAYQKTKNLGRFMALKLLTGRSQFPTVRLRMDLIITSATLLLTSRLIVGLKTIRS